ncbi:MAG: type I glutamate--ammonia ligase [candidate division WOR-3 bacterium]
MDFSEVKKLIENGKVKIVDFRFSCLVGTLRHVSIDPEYFLKGYEKGIGIDGSSVPGYAEVHNSDMRLFPDLDSAFMDPTREGVLVVYGDLYYSDTKEPYPVYPRNILKRAIEFVKNSNFAEKVEILPELEFYIFENAEITETGYYFDFVEEKRLKSSYHIAEPYDAFFELRTQILEHLKMAGVKVKYHHHEVGGYGQNEVELTFGDALQMADALETAKYIIRRVVQDAGLVVTFMPKPLFNEPGNGLHFHIILKKNGESVFYGDEHNLGLSKTALYFIGGILKHARALSALVNPSTNSYKRLYSGFEAPVAITYALANRTAAIRIPGYAKGKDVDIEYRSPDATMNTYIGIAGLIMAGMDGIINKIDPGEPFEGKVDADVVRSGKVKLLPENLKEALSALKEDYKFLLTGGVFTQEFVEKWIDIKMKEFERVNSMPHPQEFVDYF